VGSLYIIKSNDYYKFRTLIFINIILAIETIELSGGYQGGTGERERILLGDKWDCITFSLVIWST